MRIRLLALHRQRSSLTNEVRRGTLRRQVLSSPRCTCRRLSSHDVDPRCHACTALFGIAFSGFEIIALKFILEMKCHPGVRNNVNLLLSSLIHPDRGPHLPWSSAYTRPYRGGNSGQCRLTLIQREDHSKSHALVLRAQNHQAEDP